MNDNTVFHSEFTSYNWSTSTVHFRELAKLFVSIIVRNQILLSRVLLVETVQNVV